MTVKVVSAAAAGSDAVPVLFYRGEKEPQAPAGLLEIGRALRSLTGLEPGKAGWHLIPTADKKTPRVILAELPAEGCLARALRNGCANLQRELDGRGIKAIRLYFPEALDDRLTQAAAEGILLGGYCFDKYRTARPKYAGPEEVFLDGTELGLKRAEAFAGGQIRSRSLANEPGNVIGPAEMAHCAQEVARAGGLECTVYDEGQIHEMGMEALFAVGRGSAKRPRFVHMVYRPQGIENPKRVVFVGKSVTFDSGGLSIKTRDGMITMKGDKTGACNVLGIMEAVAALRPSLEVHGIFGAVENMPDGDAYRVDDIIRAKNGKTIEVKNTDAEGRLTLADALAYACELKPDALIDMATLTGAIGTALGGYTAGALGDDAALAQAIIDAGKAVGERFHYFPLDDDKLKEKISTPFADVKNSAGPGGGAITAGMFLREFVVPGTSWIHLDIASVDYYESAFDCYSAGASSFSVRTCLQYLMNLEK